jgi:hypothetical protein
MSIICKNYGKEFELFNSEFCQMEFLEDYYLKSYVKY